MFSAVNSPPPRVVFGMVVSGGGGVRLLLVGGCAQSGAVELSRLWALGVQSWPTTCYGGLFGLLFDPLGAAKKGGSVEPPFVGRFALSSVISIRRKLRDNGIYRAAKYGSVRLLRFL